MCLTANTDTGVHFVRKYTVLRDPTEGWPCSLKSSSIGHLALTHTMLKPLENVFRPGMRCNVCVCVCVDEDTVGTISFSLLGLTQPVMHFRLPELLL